MSKTNSAPGSTSAAGAPTPSGGGHKPATLSTPSKHNVVSLPGMCLTEGCKNRSEKANFCKEHFDWFKEGLVTKEGRKPSDFDKKFFDYTRRLAKKKSA
jgi:hypothetical protein